MTTADLRKLPRVAFRGRTQRPIEDRLATRFPRLARRLAALLTPLVVRMPRHWRLRRLLVDWSIWRNVNARHRGDLEAVRTMWHPECVFDFSRAEGWIGAGVYRGHEGIAQLFAEWGEAWREGGWVDAGSLEDVHLEEFDGGVFLIDTPVRGVGRASGAVVVMDRPHIIELREGLPWRFEHFTDRAEAAKEAEARSSRMSDAIVRWKIEPLERSRRGLDEWLQLAVPRELRRVLGRLLTRSRAGSRTRRALLKRLIRVGFAANNRLDYDSMCAVYDPAVEIRLIGGATRIDLEPVYWGHEGLRKVNDDWRAGFGEFRFEPREVIDPGGDRFGLLVEFHGQTSGMMTNQLTGFIFTIRDGLAIRQDFYWDWEEAVEALGTPTH